MPQTLVLEAIPFALAGTLTTLSANADPSIRASLPVCPAQTLAWPSFEPALDQRQPQGADTMSSSECRGSRDPNGKGLPMWPAVSEKPAVTMQIGDQTEVLPIAGPPAKLEFWQQYLSRPR